jgi:cytoskeletal protein CcmA (bactofilin family)
MLPWFDRKKGGGPEEWTGFLEKGVNLEGKLEAKGTFRIDSRLKGSIASEEMLILGENSVVEGDITGNQIVIGGRFEGTIVAKGKVQIQGKAVVTAEIHTPCLIIEPGGIFDGQCHMLAASAPQVVKLITIPIRSASHQ